MKKIPDNIPVKSNNGMEYGVEPEAFYRFHVVSVKGSPRNIGEIGVVARSESEAQEKAISRAIAIHGPDVHVALKGVVKI